MSRFNKTKDSTSLYDDASKWDDIDDDGHLENYINKLERSERKRNAQARRRCEWLQEERRLKELLRDEFAP